MDALALEADEGRDKRRNAAGRGKYSTIRRYPNGATHHVEGMVSYMEAIRRELKYLSTCRKRK